MRDVTFCPGTLRPAVDRFVRKVGRPRLDSKTEVAKLALTNAGAVCLLDVLIGEASRWHEVVKLFTMCFSNNVSALRFVRFCFLSSDLCCMDPSGVGHCVVLKPAHVSRETIE